MFYVAFHSSSKQANTNDVFLGLVEDPAGPTTLRAAIENAATRCPPLPAHCPPVAPHWPS